MMDPKGRNTFEAVAMPHLPLLYRVARRLTRDDHHAEDLVQETYLKAYRAFNSFELRSFGIKPWLLKILNNTFLNRQAKESRGPRSVDHSTLEETHAADETTVLPELDLEHVDEELKAALDGLSPDFRSVLLLWATMELSYQEIADILGLPIGTVMSRLHRARQHVTRQLGEFARENRLQRVKK